MKETCTLLDTYIRNFDLNSEPLTAPLFFNKKGQALSRYGITYILKKYVSKAELDGSARKISPHGLRHTKAMHLLRAGVNMIYIRDFLGHVDISTTDVFGFSVLVHIFLHFFLGQSSEIVLRESADKERSGDYGMTVIQITVALHTDELRLLISHIMWCTT
jgi:hypothetical protein